MTRVSVHIAGGGDPGPAGRAAITEAVERALSRRDAGKERTVTEPAWARAGRLEAMSSVRVRSWSQLAEH